MLNFRKNLILGGAGGPDALQTSSEGVEQYRGGNFQLLWYAVGRKGAMLNFCEGLMVAGAGGPVALQTSSPARRPSRAASFSARGPAGLTCRAPLDSVRLRRNRSLLLCVPQSSSLTCARGALRACAREKTRVLLQCQAVLSHALAALSALDKARYDIRSGDRATPADSYGRLPQMSYSSGKRNSVRRR